MEMMEWRWENPRNLDEEILYEQIFSDAFAMIRKVDAVERGEFGEEAFIEISSEITGPLCLALIQIVMAEAMVIQAISGGAISFHEIIDRLEEDRPRFPYEGEPEDGAAYGSQVAGEDSPDRPVGSGEIDGVVEPE